MDIPKNCKSQNKNYDIHNDSYWYLCTSGRKRFRNNRIFDKIQEVIDKANKKDYIIIAGGFNSRTGNQPVGGCIGSEGEPTISNNGRFLIDFCLFNNLKITNSFFRHKNIHKYIWEARGLQSVTYYIIVNEKLKPNIRDTRVFRGSEIDSDHFLVESKFKFCRHTLYHRK
jgi:hypothetical protein